MDNNQLNNHLRSLYIEAKDEEIKKLIEYLEILFNSNKFLNLTGTKDKKQILVRHIFDCLGIFKYFNIMGFKTNSNLKILDIGTGAGLPGIPISIFLPNSEIFLLDSKSKITDFLKSTVQKLGLLNVRILKERAELLAHHKEYRGSFDLVTARAVASAAVLSEVAIPFCRIGGRTLLYKSRKLHEELSRAEDVIGAIGARVEKIVEIQIPLLDEYRALIILKKECDTIFKYPRKYGKISKIHYNV